MDTRSQYEDGQDEEDAEEFAFTMTRNIKRKKSRQVMPTDMENQNHCTL